MALRAYGPSTVALVALVARFAAASCTTDDPGGTKVLAAREQVQTDCPCDQTEPPAVTHGQYVSCAANVANMRAALDPSDPNFLPKTCKGAVKKCAAKSVCGKPGFVTCCITNEKSVTKCKTRKDAPSCAAKNGIVGVCTSCCDACPSPGSGPSCPGPTTTTSTATTTTTLGGPALKFTVVTGTSDCGAAGLETPPAPPTSGEVDSDTAGTTKISDLGLGCLYLGGGDGTAVRPARLPDGATTLYAITGPGTLGASPGTGPQDCSLGVGATSHCVNNNSEPACASDGDCGGSPGSCAPDADCYFGPPVPLPSPAPFNAYSACLLNVVQSDASGTFDESTGTSSISLQLSSRLYVTGNSASPCPKCLSGTCDPTWKDLVAEMSPDAGAACTAVGSDQTSGECQPNRADYYAILPIDLTPLTTAMASMTAAGGNFCPSQSMAGAFGQPTAERIAESGSAAGDISDGLPHTAALASVLCVPGTGSPAIDGLIGLPGPSALSIRGNVQMMP